MNLAPSSQDEIRQEIAKIASLYGVFQCIECSQAIKKLLIAKNVQGKQIKLDLGRQDLPWSVIYDWRREQQISTNGLVKMDKIVSEKRDWVTCVYSIYHLVLRLTPF